MDSISSRTQKMVQLVSLNKQLRSKIVQMRKPRMSPFTEDPNYVPSEESNSSSDEDAYAYEKSSECSQQIAEIDNDDTGRNQYALEMLPEERNEENLQIVMEGITDQATPQHITAESEQTGGCSIEICVQNVLKDIIDKVENCYMKPSGEERKRRKYLTTVKERKLMKVEEEKQRHSIKTTCGAHTCKKNVIQ